MVFSGIDRLIGAVDRTLRVVAGVVEPRRASPADGIPEGEPLSAGEKKEAAALMRVNHAGEVCAQALYRGQALASRNTGLKAVLAESAQEEIDHMAWSQDRIHELGGRTSLLNPLWYAGSFLLGYGAGKLGDEINLGFLAETERQVQRHLEGHLRRLCLHDVRTRSVVEAMARDEASHAATAVSLGAAQFPAPAKQAMAMASRVMTTLAYHF
jgi:ubiquinone biosynthesis monooxygenase Coq7